MSGDAIARLQVLDEAIAADLAALDPDAASPDALDALAGRIERRAGIVAAIAEGGDDAARETARRATERIRAALARHGHALIERLEALGRSPSSPYRAPSPDRLDRHA